MGDTYEPPGRPAYCSVCESPIVVYESPRFGYNLVCMCENTRVDIDDTAANSTLFTPISGKWSNIDNVDPWDGTDI